MTGKQTSKSIAVTPKIRAKTSAPAFVAAGHNHDDRYIRYDDEQTGISNDESNRLLENINGGTSATAKLVRADVEQNLTSVSKERARENIGIIDDVNASDGDGNITISQFGNNIAGSGVTNNDLLSHFIRHDLDQTLSDVNKIQFASNAEVFTLVDGSSEQVVASSVRFNSSSFIIDLTKAEMNRGAIIKGIPLNDTQATVKIAAPNGTETAIIEINSGVAAASTVAMSCSNKKITLLANPTNNTDAANKNYVDEQIDALDLAASYVKIDGENAMGANLLMDSNLIKNVGSPVDANDAANKDYVDDASEILTGVNNNTAGGFNVLSSSVTPSRNGVHLVVLSGKVTSGSAGVLTVNVIQDSLIIESRYINTDGSGQWSLTIPVTLSSQDPLSVSGSSGVVFNQFDVVQFGY